MRKWPLIAAAIVMPSCAVILVVSSISMSSARSDLNEIKMAEAYSCAFVAGQSAIMNRLPSLFPGGRSAPAGCASFEAIAAKHGFNNH